ncbi:MAG: L-serine ammonia-lyase, iron-sulfur-dependent, subunit alpha [Eubacteriales bacterium]|nr:L-serine ammonia-lyase, iron-sulfur-dependent, subunit alpha [Eubacteriales bacterium]
MEEKIYREYINILREELVPAMGCTEPIAVAYCAALASETLGERPEKVKVWASANIIKNVKSVFVPNTGGQRGIAAAAAAGIISGAAAAKLQVLAELGEEQIRQIPTFLESVEFQIERSENEYVFDIQVELTAGEHRAFAEIAGHHTNVICRKRDDQILFEKEYVEQGNSCTTDRSLLNVSDIVEFADTVELAQVQETLQRQIDYNTAIAEEGLRGDYGANIGRILLRSYGSSVNNRAKAYAAAGSDGRMNGCELPVVINSGSGNQGLTASLPVIVYAKELNVSQEMLYRALIVSNLVTIHLKTGIGRLSAYCGATSAGCGAGAGITYLYGGKCREISHTIVNALAINSGMICDGAKASCAAKIASAVEAGLLGMQMQKHDSQFYDGDGIVVKGVENTIRNVGELAREGMRETDRTIIEMMTGYNNRNEDERI